ncbi:Aste57867_24388 [Aphanomyces stellatus]|uniref:Aste57867_24388 protein n=1 Tax=Aphanomyces stellatus TaxID=120398 RepID=A0A485LRE0_9STRA|nr:hypothetical protein As57867_024312 [Aphanomyces stellatus]VFU01028.1 Aste57867_24388 [Aphanomyces stellatus]
MVKQRKSTASAVLLEEDAPQMQQPVPVKTGLFKSKLRLPFHREHRDSNASEMRVSDVGEDDIPVDEKKSGKKTPPKPTGTSECHMCKMHLGLRRYKHHCRNCGNSVCSSHSKNQLPLPHFGILRAVRVCDRCTKEVLQQRVGIRRGTSLFQENVANDSAIGGVLYSGMVEEQDDTMDNVLYLGSLKMTGRSIASRNMNSNVAIWKDRMLVITPAEILCFKHYADSGLGEVRSTVHMTDILHVYISEKYPNILSIVRADGRIFRIRAKDKEQSHAIQDILVKTIQLFQDALYKLQRGVHPEDFSITSVTVQHAASMPEQVIMAFPQVGDLLGVKLYPSSIVRIYVTGPVASGVATFTYTSLTTNVYQQPLGAHEIVRQKCEMPHAVEANSGDGLEVHVTSESHSKPWSSTAELGGIAAAAAIVTVGQLWMLPHVVVVALLLALVFVQHATSMEYTTYFGLLWASRFDIGMVASHRVLSVKQVTLAAKGACDDATDEDDMPENDVFRRFVEGASGDIELAKRKYFAMLNWRKAEDIDNILSKPHEHYATFKECMVSYIHKRDKCGRMILVDKSGTMKKSMHALFARGVTEDDACYHTAFIMDYQWKVLDTRNYPDGQMLRIIDLKGISMEVMSSEVFGFAKKIGSIVGQYNAERIYKVIIVNPPAWFNMIWKVVSPLINPKTRDKTIVVRGAAEITKTLLEYVDLENIPAEYGGSCACEGGCINNSPEEIELRDVVAKLNSKDIAGAHELMRQIRERPIPLSSVREERQDSPRQ